MTYKKSKKSGKNKNSNKNLITKKHSTVISKDTKEISTSQVQYARTHKDRLFRFIFNQKPELLSLYNAINGSDYTDENDLTIYTIEDFIYMGMKNDISFLIDCNLNIFEHQSTYNPNMPLRGFLYMASAFKKYIAAKHMDIYSSTCIPIPVPRFYVFYNGTKVVPDEQILKLTDHMPDIKKDQSCTEFTATMININAHHNPKLLERCPILFDYAVFISRIRENLDKSMSLADALEQAVTDCIHDNILADILRNHKAEVTDMILDEYDEKFHIACEKKISYEQGLAEGRALANNAIQAEKQRADDTITLFKNVLRLHLKQISDEMIADELHVSVDTVRQIIKDLDSNTADD